MLNNFQKTLKGPVSLSGIGLHTGKKCRLTIHPAKEGAGISFVRTDIKNNPTISANVKNVAATNRGTVLEQNCTKVHTVEHLLSALYGMGIDNAKIELTGPEPPILDGSTKLYIKAINSIGIANQTKLKNAHIIHKPIRYRDQGNDIEINIFPQDHFKITYIMDYNLKDLGVQYSSIENVENEYIKEVAPARTFGLISEIAYLIENNLIKGGSLNNSVVFVDRELSSDEQNIISNKFGKTIKLDFKKGSILNTEGLRFQNEPVRHKVLDLIGDLALFGRPIYGHVVAKKSGHTANIELVKELKRIAL